MMRIETLAGLMLLPAVLGGQAVSLAGQIRGEGQAPLQGATMRLTGGETRTTNRDGRFRFEQLTPGRYILAVTAIGYEPRSIELILDRGETAIAVALTRSAVMLDTVLVRPAAIRIRGTAVDSASGETILHASAILYPGARVVRAKGGEFKFDSVPPGPAMIVVEGLEHVPTALHLDATRDTSVTVGMAVDSVAIRMMAAGAKRLASRLTAASLPMTALNRTDIARQNVSVGDIVSRLLYENPMEVRKNFASAEDGCFFLDDKKVSRQMYEGMDATEIERIEILRRAGAETPNLNTPRTSQMRNFGDARMVRVYTKRFAVTLPSRDPLPRIVYVRSGLGFVCK
jgi:hypothetical protein